MRVTFQGRMGGENSKYIEQEMPVYQQLTFLPKESAPIVQYRSSIHMDL